MATSSPTALLILDGWGHRVDTVFNAPALAKTPNFDELWRNRPRALLHASGRHVGLPEGQIGNSEVGHLTIGAGRVVLQTLPRIDAAINSTQAWTSQAFVRTVQQTRAGTGRLHLIGLMSPGGVHAHQRHLAAAANAFHTAGLEVVLHLITDGRDTAPTIAAQCWADLQNTLVFTPRIGSVCGRFYAMDRDQRWARTQAAVEVIRDAKGQEIGDLGQYLGAKERDEFIVPSRVAGYEGMHDGDGLACINFRSDRIRQLLRAFLVEGTPGYVPCAFSGCLAMAPYAEDLDQVMEILFPKDWIPETLAAVVSKAGKTQFHLAETEKYPHVTFFLNGGREAPWPGETRTMIPSPKVATYDLAPQMSAARVASTLETAMIEGQHDLLICNLANPDMVGHTGDLDAAILACEAVDRALGRFLSVVTQLGATALITADHGNAELMWDETTKAAHTAHTLSPVPLIHLGPGTGRLANGGLADLAPTLLHFMGLPQPAAMTGRNLWFAT